MRPALTGSGLILAVLIVGGGVGVLPTMATPQPTSDITTGGALEQMCTGDGARLAVACHAYLQGMYEGLRAGQLSSTDLVSFCPPDHGVGAEDIRHAFLDHIDADPASRTEEAGMALLDALEEQFPCHPDQGSTDPPYIVYEIV